MSWYRIDERREISADFITCSEYQLFLDEKRAQNEYYQPDHWKKNRFSKGQAQNPILGARGEDAELFCEWLNQRKASKLLICHRLPTLEEVIANPPVAGGYIDCWCVAGGNLLVDSDQMRWAKWRESLYSVFIRDWVRTYNYKHDHALRNALDRFHNHVFNFTLTFYRARDYFLTLNRALDRNRGLPQSALDRVLACALDQSCTRAIGYDLVNNLDCDLVKHLDCNRIHGRHFTSSKLSTLRSLCCVFIFLCTSIRDNLSNYSKPVWHSRFWPKRIEINFDIEQRLNVIFDLYAFFFLIDERRKGNLPAWEGIRIVRERLE